MITQVSLRRKHSMTTRLTTFAGEQSRRLKIWRIHGLKDIVKALFQVIAIVSQIKSRISR